MQRFMIPFLLAGMMLYSSLYAQPKLDISLQKEVEHTIINGLKWLHDQQEDDGSWQHYPAITGLVLSAFLRSHPNISAEDSTLAAGFHFLEKCVQEDGGIYIDDMKTYNTAICLMAFQDAGLLRYRKIINNGSRFILGKQFDESVDQLPDSMYYGGVSYGGNEKAPDLSNLQWSLEALQQRLQPEDRKTTAEELEIQQNTTAFFSKAIHFLQRTQNLKKYNDQPYSTDDGGFMYRPGESKAGETLSYGGMTYAGLKSFIYCGVSKEDERVRAAYDWLKRNFTVKENPGIGNQGLYYYYHTMAKALNAYGEEIITDGTGKDHEWRSKLAGQLLQLQTTDGYWVNDNARWWENNPVLVTAYVILALEELSALPYSQTRMYLFE